MARIRAHQHYSDTRAELADYKDAYRGAVEDAFWDESELVDHRPLKKKKRKKREGCTANDGNAHVWVWVTVGHYYDWSNTTWLHDIKVCCGCEKRSRGRRSYRNYRRVDGKVPGLLDWHRY